MNSEVDPYAIKDALRLLLASEALAGSEQLQNLLEYLVRNTLEGRTSQLNELAVAENVLGRKQDFVSLTDSSARKAMSRLRARLRTYYANEGASAEIRFVMRKYSLRFEDYTPRRPRIMLLPLTPVNFQDAGYLTAELTEDLMLALADAGPLDMIPWSTAHLMEKTADLREYRRLTGADVLLDGTVRRLDKGAYQVTLMWVNGTTAVFDSYFQTRIGETGRLAALHDLARQITRHHRQAACAARFGRNPNHPGHFAGKPPDPRRSLPASSPERSADPRPSRRGDRFPAVFPTALPLRATGSDRASPLPR